MHSQVSLHFPLKDVGLKRDACSFYYALLMGRFTRFICRGPENKVMKKTSLASASGAGRGGVWVVGGSRDRCTAAESN